MGKNYFCEYCNKHVKNSYQIRKQHINGLLHQKARNEHYTNFKDVRTILSEESHKIPCIKFQQNQCKFGSSCRFSHLTNEQIEILTQQANQLEYRVWLQNQPKKFTNRIINEFLRKRNTCPSNIREMFDKLFPYPNEWQQKYQLPPSLQQIDLEKIQTNHSEWGK